MKSLQQTVWQLPNASEKLSNKRMHNMFALKFPNKKDFESIVKLHKMLLYVHVITFTLILFTFSNRVQ